MTLILRLSVVLITFFAVTAGEAGREDFKPGKAIPDFGLIVDVPTTTPLPEGLVLRHAFDRTNAAEPGTINRNMESAARFINMHYEVGVPLENINVAIVLHGASIMDATKAEFYAGRNDGKESANIALIKALLKAGARVIVCGQSSTARDIYKDDLLEGVELELSAMTAHALLQQEGYTLNPF